jgi:hypothetical protein
MKIVTILLSLLFFAVNAHSAELTPAERMLNAMGIKQILNQTKEAQSIASKEQVSMLMKQLSKTLTRLPVEKVQEIETLLNQTMIKVNNSWTTGHAIKVYSQVWSDNYTEEEILNVVEVYENPESQKEIQVTLEASAKLNSYIQGSYKAATEKAFAEFMPKLQSLIKQSHAKTTSKN